MDSSKQLQKDTAQKFYVYKRLQCHAQWGDRCKINHINYKHFPAVGAYSHKFSLAPSDETTDRIKKS